MFDWIKRLGGVMAAGDPRITLTLLFRDRGREGLEAVFDLHGEVSSAVGHWTGMNVRVLPDGVAAGTLRLSKGWFDNYKDHGFVEAAGGGQRWVIIGPTANVDVRLVNREILRLPDKVLNLLATHGVNIIGKTGREPVVDVSIEFAVEEEIESDYVGSDSDGIASFPSSTGDILTEEESAAVGRLVALGYSMAEDDRREGYSREPRRVESVDQATVPVTGTWSGGQSVSAPSGTSDVFAVPSSNAYDR